MAPKKEKVEPRPLLGRHKGNLSIGLVGLPNVGKSTTYNLLAKQTVPADNRPFCTISPHEARVHVPDERFTWLCQHFKTRSEVPAHLTVFDIAGLVPGAHQGEGLGNEFLSHIQAVDGIFHVVRAFDDSDVVHSEGEVDPIKDMQTIKDELRWKDLDRCSKALEEQERVCSRNSDKAKKDRLAALKLIFAVLSEEEKWITDGNWKTPEIEIINEFQFLTAKPVVYLVNMSESDFVRQKNKWMPKIQTWIADNLPGVIVPYSAALEGKVAAEPEEEDKKRILQEAGAPMSMIPRIIKTGYAALRLLHYFTAGEDEVRCWTIREGTKVPQAAGLIHSDFEKHFICAEVYKYGDLKELASELAVKTAGKLQQKGKEYIVEDGDVVDIKHGAAGGGGKGKKK